MDSQYDNDNIFAKIIRGEVPCDKVYEDDKLLAFNDINPAAKVHILIIPKGKYVSFDDFVANAPSEDVIYFFVTIRKIACDKGLCESGYRLVMNHGKDGGQLVPHFHVHMLGGNGLSGHVG